MTNYVNKNFSFKNVLKLKLRKLDGRLLCQNLRPLAVLQSVHSSLEFSIHFSVLFCGN